MSRQQKITALLAAGWVALVAGWFTHGIAGKALMITAVALFVAGLRINMKARG